MRLSEYYFVDFCLICLVHVVYSKQKKISVDCATDCVSKSAFLCIEHERFFAAHAFAVCNSTNQRYI